MKQHFRAAILLFCIFLFCGLTAFAAEGEQAADTTVQTASPSTALYPENVRYLTENGGRQVEKIYTLTPADNPAAIPRDDFIRDNWKYSLTDITEKKTDKTDVKPHKETVTMDTKSNKFDDVIKLLAPTLDYKSEDGYAGILTLDLTSVACEAAGYKKSSYSVTATREYSNLSANDPSLVPKSITENGRTLELSDINWRTHDTTNIDYEDVPASYTAVAQYSGTASKSVVTGYVTKALYTGDVSKTVAGNTIFTVYFTGSEIVKATPKPADTPEPSPSPNQSDNDANPTPLLLILAVGGAIALLAAGAGAFFYFRHNVKVYVVNGEKRELAAKVRITPKNPTIELTILTERANGGRFCLEVDKSAAKALNGREVEVVFGEIHLHHKIAYEGNAYKIDVDFGAEIIIAKP